MVDSFPKNVDFVRILFTLHLYLQPNSILENKEYIAQNADSIGHPAEAHLLNNVYFLSRFALFSERICDFLPKNKGSYTPDTGLSTIFLMNLIAALGACCFFDNKSEAIQGYCIEDNKQLSLF